MFWDFFRRHANASYSQPIGVQLATMSGRPPQQQSQQQQQLPDRQINFNRTHPPPSHSAPFQNGYNRPPHHPGNSRVAAAASVQRTANASVNHAAGVPRRVGAPTPSPFPGIPQGYALHHSGQPDVSEAYGMMAPNSSSAQQMAGLRQMRQRPNPGAGQPVSSPNTYRPGPSPPPSTPPSRRSTAETSSHLQAKNSDQRAAATVAAMASKKRNNSSNVSLNSMQAAGGAISSAALAAYTKNSTNTIPQQNAAKKRIRTSPGYSDNYSQIIGTPMSNNRHQNITQARYQQNFDLRNQRMQAMGLATSQQQSQQQQQQHPQQQSQPPPPPQQQQHAQLHPMFMPRAQNKQPNNQNAPRSVGSGQPGGQVVKNDSMGMNKNDAPGTSAALSMESFPVIRNDANNATNGQVNSATNEAFMYSSMQQQTQQAANGHQAAAAAAASMANARSNSRTSPQTRQRAGMNVRSKKTTPANNRATDSSQSGLPSGGVVVGAIANNALNNPARDTYNATGTTHDNSARQSTGPGNSAELMSRMAVANGRKSADNVPVTGVDPDKGNGGSGGGTPSQRSGVSGMSGGGSNKRPAKHTSRKGRVRNSRKKGVTSPDAPKKSNVAQSQQAQAPPPPQQAPAPPPPTSTQAEQRNVKKEGAPTNIAADFPLELDAPFDLTLFDIDGMGGMNGSLGGLDGAPRFEDTL